MTTLSQLRVKIFADGADIASMASLAENSLVKGFTTNPTLMRKAGISDYEGFAREVLSLIPDRPVSFEVFADDFDEMERQALRIASWGPNVNVKIPVTNTKQEFCGPLVSRLSKAGVALNVTALMTLEQVKAVTDALDGSANAFVSVFAGRIADTGLDPVPLMAEAVNILASKPGAQLIWASPRELLNIFHADSVGCQVITVTGDVLGKLSLLGKNLTEYSLETVQMFFRDASAAGYSL